MQLIAAEKLAWSVRVGDRSAWDARVLEYTGHDGYHLLFAVVSEGGRLVLSDRPPAGDRQDRSAPYRARPGASWEQWFQIPPELGQGEHALVILARRGGGFDADALGQVLRARAGVADGADFVNRAVNFLQSRAPGFLVYQFSRSEEVVDRCEDQRTEP